MGAGTIGPMPNDPNKPVDFTAADCAIVPVDLADRPAGDIAYRVTATDYRETYTFNNGSLQQITAVVPWEDANDFIDFSLGYTTWVRSDASRFHRVLPLQSAYQSTMYCEACELMRYASYQDDIRTSETAGYWPSTDAAVYNLTFRPRLYDMLTDAQVDSADYPWAAAGCKELGRYVQRILTPRVEELKIGQFRLEAENPASPGSWTVIPEVGFVPFVRTDVVYIWYQVPYDAVPLDAIDNCGAKVNSAAFDKKLTVTGTGYTDRWATGTLLFKGLAQELSPVPGPNGELLCDVYYSFSHQPNGWNKFPPPDPTSADWWTVRRRGVSPDAPLYAGADFRTLFKPRTS